MPQSADIRTGVLFDVDPDQARVKRLRRRVWTWANIMSEAEIRTGDKWYMHMVTLTYRPGVEWSPNHVREAMLRARAHYKSDLVGYAWVAELQERGAVHYHVLTVTRRKRRLFWDKKRFWAHGSSNVLEARSWGYVVKYAQKTQTTKGYPKGARLFAVWSAAGILTADERRRMADSAQPGWARDLRDSLDPGGRIRRVGDGRLAIGDRLVRSPFVLVGTVAKIAIKRLGVARWAEIMGQKRQDWGLCQVRSQPYNDGYQTSAEFKREDFKNVVLQSQGAWAVDGAVHHQHVLLPR